MSYRFFLFANTIIFHFSLSICHYFYVILTFFYYIFFKIYTHFSILKYFFWRSDTFIMSLRHFLFFFSQNTHLFTLLFAHYCHFVIDFLPLRQIFKYFLNLLLTFMSLCHINNDVLTNSQFHNSFSEALSEKISRLRPVVSGTVNFFFNDLI